MKKLSKLSLSLLKLSLLVFITSFLCIAFGVREAEIVAGTSFAASILFLPMFIILKFSDAIINVFQSVAGLFKKSDE
jgi:hypothetical protein